MPRQQAKSGSTGPAKTRKRGVSNASGSGKMTAPKSGVKVRMYRQGHGDCFLLAFRGERGKPVYVLIDCGYKPGSNGPEYNLQTIDDVVDDIKEATSRRLDVVVITHEHQDHVNGFWRKQDAPFRDFKIGEAWFAWTEDPDDPLANELRQRHHDQLLGLIGARNKLAADDNAEVDWLDDLLTLELGLEFEEGVNRTTQFRAAAADRKKNPENSVNKQGMKLIKDLAEKDIKYIKPHAGILKVPGVAGVRVFAFGPPYDANLIADEDPKGAEAFPDRSLSRSSFLFAAAEAANDDGKVDDGNAEDLYLSPFARRFSVPMDERFTDERCGDHFKKWYGDENKKPLAEAKKNGEWREVEDGAPWRQIDQDWLHSAEQLAIALNSGVNNTSLVLAFELPKSKKVLLFVGDAQRGNWISWTKGRWKDDKDKEITVRDLMSRTVLYKVGHHGSHNATLSGKADSAYPCLAWMGHGKYSKEFTAMVTAVTDWAHHKQHPPWNHPLESIKKALEEKTGKRVFQTDTDIDLSAQQWKVCKNLNPGRLFFEYDILDEL